eukprot:4796213-Lingulodinium_polyedra.AAC.1
MAGVRCHVQLVWNVGLRLRAAGIGLADASSRTVRLLAAWPTAFAWGAALLAWWWGPSWPSPLPAEAVMAATEAFSLPNGYNKVAVVFVG